MFMKHLKTFENNYDRNSQYSWLESGIITHFFIGQDNYYSEVFDDDPDCDVIIVLEFLASNINIKLMQQIIDFMKFVDNVGVISFFAQTNGGDAIGMEVKIKNLVRVENFLVDKLGVKYSPKIRDYNL